MKNMVERRVKNVLEIEKKWTMDKFKRETFDVSSW